MIVDTISSAIRNVSSGRTLIASLAFFAVSAVLVNGRPFGLARLAEITGGAGILDMEFTYTPVQAYAMLAALGDAGREFYLTRIVPLDLVFPLAYTLFFAVTITWLLSRRLPEGSPWMRLNVVPLIAGAADYGENIGVIALLLSYPAELYGVAGFTAVMSPIKYTFIAVSMLIVLGALAGWAVSGLRGR
ncbi:MULTISPECIES: hypothetical protein [unclassified Methanoculleus]|uniref:hypothetical protein n=1 Tax=unclassified Methanoculleus TaxID=2619537 RepID=UPI0025DD8B24|nr:MULTISPECIES: hypothetical protein [unclassified Methanoculleus]